MFSSLRKFATGAAVTCGVSLLLVTFTPVTRWWVEALSREWHPPKGDILIVLAADAADENTIGGQSYWRAVYAIWAWRAGTFRRIIVSGGGRPAPALPTRAFLIAHGIPSEAILVETVSTTTRENALQVARILQGEPGRLILLTSDYHSFRATRVFRRAGLAVFPSPAPDALKGAGQWRHRWTVFLQLAEETMKIMGYGWRGHL